MPTNPQLRAPTSTSTQAILCTTHMRLNIIIERTIRVNSQNSIAYLSLRCKACLCVVMSAFSSFLEAFARRIPFVLVHLAPLGAIWTGFTTSDVVLCVTLYFTRMFFITAGYHRYFSHRSFELNRFWQFMMALGGTLAAQKGPLWWASHHRVHHAFSDTPKDIHPPQLGFWWSHLGWIFSANYRHTEQAWVRDLGRFPELRWLDRYYIIPPIVLGVVIFLVGGWSALLIGFFLSTVFLFHGTFSINSLMHRIGKRRYQTADTSKNSFVLALLTNGEGWHNNHHYYRYSARQGFYWWEIDASYYVLKILSWMGIVRALKPVPIEVREAYRNE